MITAFLIDDRIAERPSKKTKNLTLVIGMPLLLSFHGEHLLREISIIKDAQDFQPPWDSQRLWDLGAQFRDGTAYEGLSL
jgi:hypothetical protein